MKHLVFTALAGLLVACTQNSTSPTATAESAPASNEVSSSENSIYSDEAIAIKRLGNPDGQTILLIPGLASSPEVWDTLTPVLMDYDLRLIHVSGFAGRAPMEMMGAETMDVEDVTQAIATHLNTEPGRDTVIIGHSLGGYLVLTIGMENSVPLTDIIIVDSLPYLSGMMMPGQSPEQAAEIAAALSERMKALPRAQFDAQQAMGLSRLVKDQSAIPRLKQWGQTSDQKTVAEFMAHLLSSDLRADVAKIKTPITVLAAYDPAMGVSAEQMKALYSEQYAKSPQIDIHLIEDSFHFIMLDQPVRFETHIKAVLSEN
jgi:pimeloyl-ACP methyl ester carboxylesterase